MIPDIPFVIAPEKKFSLVGNEKIGVLKFPCLGGLTVAEQMEVDEAMHRVSPFSLASDLAVRIQQEQEIKDLCLCLECVVGRDHNVERSTAEIQLIKENSIRYARWIEEINQYSDSASSINRERRAIVTAIMGRIVPDWSEARTKSLVSTLFQAIWEFAQSEISGGKEHIAPPPTEEDIKKPQGASTSYPSGQTGQISSGESKDIVPGMTDLAPPTLLASPAG